MFIKTKCSLRALKHLSSTKRGKVDADVCDAAVRTRTGCRPRPGVGQWRNSSENEGRVFGEIPILRVWEGRDWEEGVQGMPTGLKGYGTNPSGKKLPRHPAKAQEITASVLGVWLIPDCPCARAEKWWWGFWLLERSWGLQWTYPCMLVGQVVWSMILADLGTYRDFPSE